VIKSAPVTRIELHEPSYVFRVGNYNIFPVVSLPLKQIFQCADVFADSTDIDTKMRPIQCPSQKQTPELNSKQRY
jgi:hypothetical protein